MRLLISTLLCLPFIVAAGTGQEKEKGPKKRELDPLMADKLKQAQLLLEGLALNDHAKIGKSADSLLAISKEAEFRNARPTPAYMLHMNNFQRAAETISAKAKEKNLDGATLAYLEMTQSCVRCHQHAREVRIGFVPQPIPTTGRKDVAE